MSRSKITIHLKRPDVDPMAKSVYWCGHPLPAQPFMAIGETCLECKTAKEATLATPPISQPAN